MHRASKSFFSYLNQAPLVSLYFKEGENIDKRACSPVRCSVKFELGLNNMMKCSLVAGFGLKGDSLH